MENVNPIRKILIANRGEIARRIIRTAKDMGIATVAIYSESDATAPFVLEADSAIALQGTSPAETYLDTDQVLEACRISGADALHPAMASCLKTPPSRKPLVTKASFLSDLPPRLLIRWATNSPPKN